MITDITKLFTDLTKLFLTAYNSHNDIDFRQNPNNIPVYDLSEGWLDSGSILQKRHNKPVYIRYTTSASLSDGKAIRLGVTTEPNGTEYKYYYMAPVYYNDSNMTYEINLNEILSRDLNRGVLNNILFKVDYYTIDNTTWVITETNDSLTGNFQMFPDNYSRTTVIDDIFLFNVTFNKLKEYLEELDVYNKPIVNISGNNILDKTHISQFEDMILRIENDTGYYSCTVYASGPEDTKPGDVDGGDYDDKFNLIYNGETYNIHLNDFYHDMVIDDENRHELDFIYYLKNNAGESEPSSNLTLYYYATDDNINTENLKSAFNNIHNYI